MEGKMKTDEPTSVNKASGHVASSSQDRRMRTDHPGSI